MTLLPLQPLADDLSHFFSQRLPFPPQPSQLAVAWSGGADSTALLFSTLLFLRQRYGDPLPAPLLALHIDHDLRPDSSGDALWCQTLTARFPDLTLSSTKLSTGPALAALPGSPETRARELRYNAFGDLLKAHPERRFLLTAHHSDDNLECLLLALIRGAGVSGLAGFQPSIPLASLSYAGTSAIVIRPFINTTREAIVRHLKETDLGWREDPTNAQLNCRRNQLRHLVLPTLSQIAEGNLAPMRRSMRALQQDRDLLRQLACSDLEDAQRELPWYFREGLAVDRRWLLSQMNARQAHLLRAALAKAGLATPPDFASTHRIIDALNNVGATVTIHGATIFIGADVVSMHTSPDPVMSAPTAEASLTVPGKLSWGDRFVVEAAVTAAERGSIQRWIQRSKTTPQTLTDAITFCDADQLCGPLRLRPPEPGERITRFTGQHKKISRIFKDKKIPLKARPWLPVVEDARGRVLWIPYAVRTPQAQLSKETKRILTISWRL